MSVPPTASHPSPWRVAAASVQGTSHQRAGLPCQDALHWQSCPNHTLLVALADGAGSARLADIGATTAATFALAWLSQRLTAQPWPTTEEDWLDLLREGLVEARRALLTTATNREIPLRDLATTLTLLVVTPGCSAAAQVGDGASLVGTAFDDLALLTRPANAEYLNETTFLTSDTALDQPQACYRPGPVKHVAVFSDGLQLLALQLAQGKAHPGFFQPLFRFVQQSSDVTSASAEIECFLRSPRVAQRADDDLSLFLGTWGDSPTNART